MLDASFREPSMGIIPWSENEKRASKDPGFHCSGEPVVEPGAACLSILPLEFSDILENSFMGPNRIGIFDDSQKVECKLTFILFM